MCLVCRDCGARYASAGERCPFCGGALAPGEAEYITTPLGEARLGERLGRGSHTEVWAGTLPGGVEVALKRRRAGDEEGAARIAREADLLARCRHAGLIELLAVAGSPERPEALVLPRYERDLGALTREARAKLDLEALASTVAGALMALHEADVLHRDVRAANVLVRTIDERLEYVLGDLSHASAPGVPPLTPEGHVVGTHGCIAPECVGGAPASSASDVYAFGVMLFALVTGERPFAHPDLEVELSRAATEDAFPLRSYRHALPVAEGLARLVEAAVHRDPTRRPRLEAFAKMHPPKKLISESSLDQ